MCEFYGRGVVRFYSLNRVRAGMMLGFVPGFRMGGRSSFASHLGNHCAVREMGDSDLCPIFSPKVPSAML